MKLAAVLLALSLATACNGQPRKDQPTSPPISASSRPTSLAVTDTAPYWCDLVSQEALAQVTGMDKGLTESRTGDGRSLSICRVEDGAPAGPLAVSWEVDDGRRAVERQSRDMDEHHLGKQIQLPHELGSGFVVYSRVLDREPLDDRPYYAIAAFRCGAVEPWVSIDVIKTLSGRDYVRDLTELMRIAQKRYGVLHKCTPRPAK